MLIQLTAKEFVSDLRSALAHLYEPLELKRSRLVTIFQLEASADRPAALRKVLQDGIQALKMENAAPADSPSARAYEVLYYRYIEQSALKEVAAELALSVRHVHRIETSGLEYLSEYFQTKYHLTFLPDGDEAAPVLADSAANEMEWLRKSSKGEDVNLSALLESVIDTLHPLTQQTHIGVQVHCESGQTWVHGDPTILRQAMMNSLLAAIQVNPDGEIVASVHLRPEGISLTVSNTCPAAGLDDARMAETVASIHQLMTLTGGAVETDLQPGACFHLSLIFPARDRTLVMVVDDNADALLLMERFLTGTVFQFLGVRDPGAVIAMIEKYRPRVLILDVMLPGIDGWQLLSSLKEAGLLKDTQVVVSTILPQESLALAFHAAGFLRKPVTREKLLTTLNQLSSPAAK